jgi:glycosyltransferase involved in cell wall biosynthesis
MKNNLVSVIIPVYNAEKFLEDCLNSISKQTHKDMEIICINDGSKDGSLELLKKIAKKEKRIVIIDKKNGGQSSARNAGIKKSKSEYLAFIDADDFVSDDFIESLYQAITSCEDADMSYTDRMYSAVNANDLITANNKGKRTEGAHVLSFKEMNNLKSSACSKMMKKSFLEKHNLSFAEGLMWEDRLFSNIWKIHYPKIAFTPTGTYYHRYNAESSSSIAYQGGKKNLDSVKVFEIEYDYYKKHNQLENLEKYKWLLKHFFRTNDEFRQEFFNDMKALFSKFDEDFLKTRTKFEIDMYKCVMNNDNHKSLEDVFGKRNRNYKKLESFLRKLKVIIFQKKK